MKPHQSLPGLWQLAMTLRCPLPPFIPIVCVGHSSHLSSQALPPEPPTARSHPQNTLTALMARLAPPTSTWNPTNIHPGKLHPEKFHPSPQASLYKRCSVLCWAEADTLLGFFPPTKSLGWDIPWLPATRVFFHLSCNTYSVLLLQPWGDWWNLTKLCLPLSSPE